MFVIYDIIFLNLTHSPIRELDVLAFFESARVVEAENMDPHSK